ncbi:uncharacterized protein LOC110827999 isoform X2 [Zootermopsis nevadensis]|uniref:uncharacterized protein LOC110827999 isoform X2 n=1 Tax=Zootermopsis nevadensis TaxID=136037 RepID=UPI000B8E4C11|nr:uncharacterized protein LOC110827999 isoform X2 [Zootermopsis nevadensis]
MKTQAITIAVLALLLGAQAGLIKPPPGSAAELIKPEPGKDGELLKPAPGLEGELLKPAPGAGGSLSKPAPGTGGSLIKPAPGSEGELIKPAPGAGGSLSKPAPGTGGSLIKPAPGSEGELIKPAPGAGGSLSKPAPGTGGSLIKPAPGSEGELIKPAPGAGGSLSKPAPGTGGSLIKPAPGSEGELIKPAPGTGGALTKPAPGSEGGLIKPAPGQDEELIKPLPGTGGELIKPLPGTGGELIKPLPGTGGELIKPLPGTGGELIKPLPLDPLPGGDLVKPQPLPETGDELTKPSPGNGGSLVKPAPGTGGGLIKPAPGTGGSLIKPAPGGDGSLIKPAPGSDDDVELTRPLPPTNSDLTKPAPETRIVLPHLVLSPELEYALQNAQIFISSRILKASKNRLIPTETDLALDDIYLTIDDDISVQLSDLRLVNVPHIDVTAVKPNLEFLNLALDVDLGTLQVGGKFEVTSKNVFSDIPVFSSGEIILRNSDVKAIGKVGLSIDGDYFKTINYDILYEGTGAYLSVSYKKDEKRVVSGLDVGDQEAKVVEHINKHLQKVLNSLLKNQIENILGGIPVDNLIGESKAAQTYRGHARALRAVANEYVDAVLGEVHSYIEDNQLTELAIPDIEASFSKEILWITWHGRFGTSQGGAKDLGSVTRTGDISLDFDSTTGAITVFGNLGLSELDVKYNKYEAQFMGVGPSGTVGVHIGQNSVFLKVSLLLAIEPVISLQDFHIEYAKDISIEVTGLGVLDWLVSNIATWVVSLFNDQIVGSVDSHLQDYVSSILPTVDPYRYFS